ncbi:RNA-directed DNA polymerase, eukaryota, partial [Tanacetum coccineum]
MDPKKDEAQPSKSTNPVSSSGGKEKDSKRKAKRGYADMETKVGICKGWTMQVENQKSAGHCSFFVYADCLTTYFKMKGELDPKLFLSAQCLADSGHTGCLALARFCMNPDYGLMTTNDYPYEAVVRPLITDPSDYRSHYQREGVARYSIKSFRAVKDPAKIKRRL